MDIGRTIKHKKKYVSRQFPRFDANDVEVVADLCGVPDARLRDVSVGGASFCIGGSS